MLKRPSPGELPRVVEALADKTQKGFQETIDLLDPKR